MRPDAKNIIAEIEQLEKSGDIQGALQTANKAVTELLQTCVDGDLDPLQVKLATLYTRAGQYGEAYRIVGEVLKHNPGGAVEAEANLVLAICAAETDSISRAEEHYHRAAEISRRINDPNLLGRALHGLASSVYLIRGQFQLALATMDNAAQFIQETGQIHWGLPFLKAYIYQTMGDHARLRKALDELLSLVDPATHLAGGYYYLWARLSLDEEELEKAEEYLRLALRIANRLGTPDLNIWVRLEHSRYYRLLNLAPVARTWAADAVRYATRHGNQYFLGIALIENAQACWGAGDTASAESHLKDALDILARCEAAYDIARANFLLAAWYQSQKKAEAVQAWITAAEQILGGGYAFILERERSLAFPLVVSYLRGHNARSRELANQLMEQLAQVAPPRLRIRGLGQFKVWQGRRSIPDQSWQRRKAGDLFRRLLLEPDHSASREEILEDLWPDYTPSAAIDLLHQATSTLRHILEPDLPDRFPSRYLCLDGERIYLQLPPGTWIDFEYFEQALPIAIQTGHVDSLKQILAVYSGDLFPMDRYNDWSVSRRESLIDLHQRGLLTLGSAFLGKQQYHEALACVRRSLQRDPWNEDAVLLGMKIYASFHDIPHALQLYERLKKTLKEDLEIEPRADLRQFADALRQR